MPITITAETQTRALLASAKAESPVRARCSPRTMVSFGVDDSGRYCWKRIQSRGEPSLLRWDAWGV